MNEITEALEQNRKGQTLAALEGNKEAVACLKRIEAELMQLEAEGEWPPMLSETTH